MEGNFERKSARGASTPLHKECGPVLATGSCSCLTNVHSISAWGTLEVSAGDRELLACFPPPKPPLQVAAGQCTSPKPWWHRAGQSWEEKVRTGCCLPVSSSCKQGSGVLGFKERTHQCREVLSRHRRGVFLLSCLGSGPLAVRRPEGIGWAHPGCPTQEETCDSREQAASSAATLSHWLD